MSNPRKKTSPTKKELTRRQKAASPQGPFATWAKVPAQVGAAVTVMYRAYQWFLHPEKEWFPGAMWVAVLVAIILFIWGALVGTAPFLAWVKARVDKEPRSRYWLYPGVFVLGMFLTALFFIWTAFKTKSSQ